MGLIKQNVGAPEADTSDTEAPFEEKQVSYREVEGKIHIFYRPSLFTSDSEEDVESFEPNTLDIPDLRDATEATL